MTDSRFLRGRKGVEGGGPFDWRKFAFKGVTVEAATKGVFMLLLLLPYSNFEKGTFGSGDPKTLRGSMGYEFCWRRARVAFSFSSKSRIVGGRIGEKSSQESGGGKKLVEPASERKKNS